MDKTLLLVEQVRKNAMLFDVSDADYKNLNKRTQIWKRIAQKVDLSEDECRKRWKGLRDTYKRRMRAEKLTFRNDANPAKRWKYMDTLTFLDDFKDNRANMESSGECEKAENLLDYAALSSLSSIEDPFDLDVGESKSSCSRMSNPMKRQSHAEISTAFPEIKHEFVGTVEELCSATCPQDDDITTHLFTILAKRIADSNLSKDDVRRIERKVVALVYSELDELASK